MSKCGCAFSSLTRPCVAQRVWPMPVVAGASATRDAAAVAVARRRDGLAQVLEVADRAHRLDLARRRSREMPGRVVAAVLELLQAGEEELLRRGACRRSRRCRTWPAPSGARGAGAARAPTRPSDGRRAAGPAARAAVAGGRFSRRRARSTSATRRAQTASASSSVGASTITRTSCSVPVGRTSTRPRPSSAVALALDAAASARRRHRGVAVGDADVDEPLRAACCIACAVGEVAAARAPRASAARWRCRRRTGTKPMSMMWPDCSPPSAQPRSRSSSST